MRARHRLALCSGAFDGAPDGSNQALGRLVAALRTRGWAVRVYGPVRSPQDAAQSAERRITGSWLIPGRPDYRLALPLDEAALMDLALFSPDIVHVASPDPLAWSAIRAARTLGAAVVASAHTRFETYLPYYGLGWLAPAAKAYLAAFYQHCDCVLAPTLPMVAELSAAAPGAVVRLWGRGVNRTLFSPERRDAAWRRAQGFAPDEVVALFLGRLVREKGLDAFAKAVVHARKTNPKIRALVVGDGPDRAALAARLPGAVFAGRLTGLGLAQAVASADLMLNPSRTEGFCNATAEAMASGLPIIAADVPAARAVSPPEAAILCPDSASFGAALDLLAADQALRWRLGAAARTASARFNWDAAIDMAVAAYAETLAIARRRARLCAPASVKAAISS